jgi:hypothetical protein
MKVFNVNKLINVQALHEEIEVLGIPDFTGVSFYDEREGEDKPAEEGDTRKRTVQINLGTADQDLNFVPREEWTTQEEEDIVALIESHDHKKKSKLVKDKEEKKTKKEEAIRLLKENPDPLAALILDLLD